jgi:hypothetical protein
MITNDNYSWFDVDFRLNSDYKLSRVGYIDAHTVYTVGAMEFAKSDGTRFNPFATKPLNIDISASVLNHNSASWYGTFK